MEGVLAPLVLLACPVGMALMMWFMARGMGGRSRGANPGSVQDLRTEQARLAAEIDRLEAEEQRAPSGAHAKAGS